MPPSYFRLLLLFRRYHFILLFSGGAFACTNLIHGLWSFRLPFSFVPETPLNSPAIFESLIKGLHPMQDISRLLRRVKQTSPESDARSLARRPTWKWYL